MINNFTFFCRINNFPYHLFLTVLFLAISTCVSAQSNEAPVLSATGDQIYCPGTPLEVVTSFTITDPDDTATNAVYIQISSGYINGQDILALTGTHPGINSAWDTVSGKLTLSGNGGQDVPYTQLIAATEDVVYNNTAANPTAGTRTFSITIGEANYLPSTGHYYKYISNIGISWTNARILAEQSTYYGLQGYLATLLSAEEAQLCGEQATGTGWIGGSDSQQEGVWRWMTGPEAGTIFWNGGVNGTTPNFSFWNTGEPNNQGEEDYAHITAPGVGIPGSWNDLPNNGSSGDYEPKGYIVEYGGMPGDPILQISASTTITIPEITSTTPQSRCGNGAVTLQAQTTGDTVYWYANPTGGTPLATGDSFTTPAITATTTYYASSHDSNCSTGLRTAVVATVNPLPTLSGIITPVNICGADTVNLQATPSSGTVNWYSQATGGTPIGSGNNFTTPQVNGNTFFYAEAVSTQGCVSAVRSAVEVIVTPVPTLTNVVTPADICGQGSATLQATTSAGVVNWYDAATGGSIVATGNNITTQVLNVTTTFYAEADNNGCTSASRTPVTVTVNPLPQITLGQDIFYICEEGSTVLEATTDGVSITWYTQQTGGSPIATGNTYTTPLLNEDTMYYIEAESAEGCVSAQREAVNVVVASLPTVTMVLSPVTVCNGESAVLEALPSAGTINWYTEAIGGTPVGTGTSFTTPAITADAVYYAEAENNGCASAVREMVTITVAPLPDAGDDETVTFCEGKEEVLEAGIENVTYLWSTGATTPSITVTEAGIYTVEVTTPAGCTDTKIFTAETIVSPVIDEVRISSQTATIIMENPLGNYEYSIDGVNYQESNRFTNLIDRPYTAYVRSLDGCGNDSAEFIILLVPKFFTPNGDTVNDVFSIAGMGSYYTNAVVTIYDRYGKVIVQLSRYNSSWDGTLKGEKLPATDYWYVIKLDSRTPEIRGHFSLIR